MLVTTIGHILRIYVGIARSDARMKDKHLSFANSIYKTHYNDYDYYHEKFSKCVSYDVYICTRVYSLMSLLSYIMYSYEKSVSVDMINDMWKCNDRSYEDYYHSKQTSNMLKHPGHISLQYAIDYYCNHDVYELCAPINRYVHVNDECLKLYEQHKVSYHLKTPYNKSDIIFAITQNKAT